MHSVESQSRRKELLPEGGGARRWLHPGREVDLTLKVWRVVWVGGQGNRDEWASGTLGTELLGLGGVSVQDLHCCPHRTGVAFHLERRGLRG